MIILCTVHGVTYCRSLYSNIRILLSTCFPFDSVADHLQGFTIEAILVLHWCDFVFDKKAFLHELLTKFKNLFAFFPLLPLWLKV